MAGLGEFLRQTREEKGLTLKEAQQVTKIRCRHLEALENEELDPKLGVVYYRGFLRAYARFLDLDPDSLMEELESLQPVTSVPPEEETRSVPKSEPRRPGPRPRRRKVMVHGPSPWLTLGVLLLLIAAVYFWVLRPDDAIPTPTPPPVDDVGDITQPPVDPTPPEDDDEPEPPEVVREDVGATRTNFHLAAEELDLVLNVEPGEGNECWIRATVDGVREFEGTLQPGSEMRFQASEEIILRVGKPWVLDMVLNEVELGVAGVRGRAKDIYLWAEQLEE